MSRRSLHRRRFGCFVKHLKNCALRKFYFTDDAGDVIGCGMDPRTGCAVLTRNGKVVPSVMTGVTGIYVKRAKSTPYAPVVPRSVEEILLKLKSS